MSAVLQFFLMSLVSYVLLEFNSHYWKFEFFIE